MRWLIDGVRALPLALLPRRYWQSFNLPVPNVAPLSGFLMLFAGFALGISGYFAYLERLRSAKGLSILEISEMQVTGRLPDSAAVSGIPMAMAALAPLTFALFTPVGLLATYLVASSVFRLLSSYIGEAHGDPILTGLDSSWRRMRRTHHQQREAQARLALEKTDEPDRLYEGTWAGVPDATYVVVSARRKPGWTKGTWVTTNDGWFVLGEPFDRPMPNGLRTVYPLTPQTTLEVVRKSVQYELPPLRTANSAKPAVEKEK